MGDMADMLIDQMFDDPFGEEEDDDGPAGWTIKCRCCGEEGLVWGQISGKWRLHDQEANLHICSVKPLKEEVAKSLDKTP